MPGSGVATGAGAVATTGRPPATRSLPDPRWVELLVCSTALAGARLAGRLALPVALLAGVAAVHALVLHRWPARRVVRLAWFAVLLLLLGVLPAVGYVRATDRGVAGLGPDGGRDGRDEAVRRPLFR